MRVHVLKSKHLMLTLFIVIIQILSSNAESADNPRVLVLPIEIYADNDMSFLQQGIWATITSRLTSGNQIQPIGLEEIGKALNHTTGPVDQSKAVALARQFNADYAVYGSITILGSSFSTDIHCYDVAQNRPFLVLNQSGKEQGEILEHIHSFTDQLNTKLFGSEKIAPPVTSGKPTAYRESQPSADASILIKQSPKYSDNQHSTIITPAYQPRSISQDFKTQINGMAVGDVDGDQMNEVVLLGDQSILVYRFANGRLKKTGTYQEQHVRPYLSVDVADINLNGRAEIFITLAPGSEEYLSSFVLEFNGGKFNKIAEKQEWYFRTLESPRQGKILLGQKRGRANDPRQKSRAFHGPIYELKWTGSGYGKADVVQLPIKPASLYHFDFGHPKHGTDHAVVMYAHNQRLQTISLEGDVGWTSDEAFGRNSNYLEVSNPDVRDEMMRIYVPTRMILSDVDNDGRNELIAVKNHQTLGGILKNSQMLDGGQIECLKWNGREMVPVWQTRKSLKYISDFAVADIDNDGQRELIYAVVKANTSGLNKGTSHVVTEELP